MWESFFISLVLFLFLATSFASGKDTVENHNTACELSEAERIYGLSMIWQEANYNFAFFFQVPDLDWDGAYKDYIPRVAGAESTFEYYRLLQKFCALLKDGHTYVSFPDGFEEVFDTPLIEVVNYHNKIFVVNTAKALKDRIPAGSEIIKVDGIPVDEYLKSRVFPYISSSTEHHLHLKGMEKLLEGPAGTKVCVTFITPAGDRQDLELIRNSRTINGEWLYEREICKDFEFRWLEDEIAYIALNSFLDKKILDDFKDSLAELQKSRGLIIDVRENGGGNSYIGYEIIKYLSPVPFQDIKWESPKHTGALKAWGIMAENMTPQELSLLDENDLKFLQECKCYSSGNAWYEGDIQTFEPYYDEIITVPLVVLTGNKTFSSAENFLIVLDSIDRGIFVGEVTAGSSGQSVNFPLPGGGQGKICTKRLLLADGSDLAGYGIMPDFYIEPSLNDILEGRDVILEEGIRILKEYYFPE